MNKITKYKLYYFIILICILGLQINADQIIQKEYDAPDIQIVPSYLVFGERLAKRGNINISKIGKFYSQSQFELWAATHGLMVSQDLPPFVNNMLQILGEEANHLTLGPLDLSRENILCFDFAQLVPKSDRPVQTEWFGELQLVTGGQKILIIQMPFHQFSPPVCLNINKYALPEKSLIIEINPIGGRGQFWGIYDIYLLNRLNYNPWPKPEKYSGWPLNLQ